MAEAKTDRNKQMLEELKRGDAPNKVAERHDISRQRVHQLKLKMKERGLL